MAVNDLTNKSMERALDLIDILTETGKSMSIADICKALSITRATAQAIANSLCRRDYLERDPETGRYSSGFRLFVLGNRYPLQHSFLFVGDKSVTDMARKWETKINIAVLKPRFLVVFLYSRDMLLMPQMVFGHAVPAYASAAGKMLLASLPPETLDEWCKDFSFKSYSGKTITDKDQLVAELEAIRQNGYSTEFGELMPRRACLGAPIKDISGKVIAAVSCSDSLSKIKDNYDEMARDIRHLSRTISFDLGYGRNGIDIL